MMAEDEIDLLLRDVPPSSSGGARPKLRARAAPPPRQTDEIDDLLDSVADASPAAAPPRRAPRGVIPGVAAPPPPLRRAAAPAAAAPAAVGVDPRLDSFVNDVIGEASRRSGYTYKLGEGVRTPEQQAQKVAQGVSWTYNSRHLSGRGRDVLAFDERGNYIRDGSHPAYTTLGEVYGERSAAAPAPVKWGVVKDGRQVDPGHFELGETDAIDDLLADIPDAAAVTGGDEIDALLATVPDAVDDPVERVIAVPASRAVAMESVSPTPSAPDSPNIYTTEGRRERDERHAAETNPRAVQPLRVQLPTEYSELSSRDVATMAVSQYAQSQGIPGNFTKDWLAKHPEVNLYGADGKPAPLLDVLGTSSFDEGTRTLSVSGQMPQLSQLRRDYEASKGMVGRGVDALTSDDSTAGEKATAAVGGALSRLGALSTGAAGLQRSVSTSIGALAGDEESQKVMDADTYSPVNIVKATWEKLKTGDTPEGFEQPIAEGLDLLYQKKNKMPLPAWRRMALEIIGDPLTYASPKVGAAVFDAAKGTRLGQRAASAVRGMRGVTVLDIERAASDGRYFVTLGDANGVKHKIETTAFYEGGGKPKIKSVPPGEDITGIGLERDGDTGRMFFNGKPQDMKLEPGGLVASPIGGRAAAAAPDVEQALPLAAPPRTARDVAKKLWRDTQDVINVSKSIAGFDVSAIGSQGGIIAGARPSLIKGAVVDAAKSTVSRRSYETFKKSLVMSPNHPLREKSGLYLASLGAPEESFASRYVQRIPGIAASERNFNVTLDALRSRAFDIYAAELTKASANEKAYRDVARWINVATGRGELGKLEPLADVLNLPMFSPRLLASKFNIISPVRYFKADPDARRIMLREMFRATGSLGVTMGLAKLAGAGVILNPFSAGFGTIDADGTSYDLSGGRLRTLRTIAQIADSINKEHRGERVREDRRPRALVEKYFRAYLSPVGQLAVDARTGENMRGEEFTGDWRELDRLIPFAVKDMRDAYRAAGVTGAAKSLPAFVGVGVNTMDKRAEPLMPTLSAPVQDELARLGLDLEHLGAKGDKSVSINPRYQTEGITGDSMRPFGGTTGKPGREVSGMGVNAEETAQRLSAELDEVLSAEINSSDWESMSDDDRAQRLDLLIVNTHKRAMNKVRVEGRGAEMEAEKKVKARLDRMSGGSSGDSRRVRHFKL
jgi:hypothetical protein